MRILRDTESINQEIATCPDRQMSAILADRLNFVVESDEGPFIVIVVEPGDSPRTLDEHFDGGFLDNAYSGRRWDEPGFVPPFEDLTEHGSFYEMLFISGDEGTLVLIPRAPGIDEQLIALCARYAESPS